ncbi:MAG: HDOD domain-containing protein [Armatimonadetes bacterium]|nr:HDOD domain-containing protein [Armatimonadota bacterium]MBS1727639.1 HDOD domain-containing protein [Armatimonadota bacterium]
MISILFVDDEVNILEGIRNSLRKRTSQWKLAFAQSGPEALDVLSKAKFDIIVSDMRMPGMDGASLLTKIQEMYPYMTRFILTGQADRDAILRAIPVTHQFIYKPCSPTDLLSLLDRTCSLHERIQSEEVRQLVSAARSVPSAPKTAQKIGQIMASSQTSLREVSEIVEHDPGLSARVLQVANSAVMGRTREVTSIAEAVSCVGLESTQALAMANDVFSSNASMHQISRLIDKTYDEAFHGAKLAALYMSERADFSVAMTSALLRDVGLIVSAGAHASIYKMALDPFVSTEELLDLEIRSLGVTHAEIGGHLLALWGTPMTVVEAVTCHHTPDEATIDPFVMAAVHLADVVAANPGQSQEEILAKLNWEFIDLHQMETVIKDWLAMDDTDLQAA